MTDFSHALFSSRLGLVVGVLRGLTDFRHYLFFDRLNLVIGGVRGLTEFGHNLFFGRLNTVVGSSRGLTDFRYNLFFDRLGLVIGFLHRVFQTSTAVTGLLRCLGRCLLKPGKLGTRFFAGVDGLKQICHVTLDRTCLLDQLLGE